MRIIDRKSLPIVFAAILFAVGMAVWHWLLRGFSSDFGTGIAIGGMLGTFITGLAIGWRRGELDS